MHRDAAAPAVLRSHAPRWCISRSTGQIPGESCLAGAHPATGPRARASSAKPSPTREALLLGTAFASGGRSLQGTADCPGALLRAKQSSLTGLTHVGHTWMPRGCPRQTSSSRDRARGGLEMVPPCRKPTGAQTSGCRRAGGAGQRCSEGDLCRLRSSLAVSTSGSFLRSLPPTGINTSETNPMALWSCVLFARSSCPFQDLLCLDISLVSGVAGPRAGCHASAGAASPCLGCPARAPACSPRRPRQPPPQPPASLSPAGAAAR